MCTFSTEFVINPNGKSEVCILHEYMQRVLKVRPVYDFFDCGKWNHVMGLFQTSKPQPGYNLHIKMLLLKHGCFF